MIRQTMVSRVDGMRIGDDITVVNHKRVNYFFLDKKIEDYDVISRQLTKLLIIVNPHVVLYMLLLAIGLCYGGEHAVDYTNSEHECEHEQEQEHGREHKQEYTQNYKKIGSTP